MDRLTRTQIEKWRRIWTDNGVISNELSALCDLALSALSQEAVREEALEEAAKIAIKIADAVRPILSAHHDDDAGAQFDTAKEIAEAIRALKRKPNAAQDRCDHDVVGSHLREPNAAAESYEAVHPKASANPAPAAPDVTSIARQLEGFDTALMHDAAALLAKLGQQVETLQAAHDLGWAHKTCPSCGADMMTGASDD